MATERNEGSQTGADLNAPGFRTGAQRDTEGIEAGTTRSMANAGETTPAMGDMSPGTAEVHSDLRVERDTGFEAIAASGTAGSRSMQQEAKDRMRQATEQAQNVAGQAQQKAREMASQAQGKVNETLDRAETRLEETGIMDMVRNNPLPALGIAFGVGFLLAGSGDDEEEQQEPRRRQKRKQGGGGAMQSAKRQLKGAIMGGLSAAVAQEGKNLMGMAQGKGNQGGILGSLFENMTGGGTTQRQGTRGQAAHRPPSHQEMH